MNQDSQPKTHGGKRAGSGRKKSSLTGTTRAIAEKLIATGEETPLEYMLKVMRQPLPEGADAIAQVRHAAMCLDAAKSAAPYMHPRLAAVEHTGPDGDPLQMVHTIELVAL